MSLILLSGGLDSALCLHQLGAELAIGFDYGQPHRIELEYAERIAKRYNVRFERHNLPLLPKIDDVVFAGRNAVMLSVAAGIAQARGIKTILIGCNKSDADRFPDCREIFIWRMNEALSWAYDVAIEAPLRNMTKAEIVKEAKSAGIMDTWTCYLPINNQPCGECYACKSLQS